MWDVLGCDSHVQETWGHSSCCQGRDSNCYCKWQILLPRGERERERATVVVNDNSCSQETRENREIKQLEPSSQLLISSCGKEIPSSTTSSSSAVFHSQYNSGKNELFSRVKEEQASSGWSFCSLCFDSWKQMCVFCQCECRLGFKPTIDHPALSKSETSIEKGGQWSTDNFMLHDYHVSYENNLKFSLTEFNSSSTSCIRFFDR
jgi:hypothetical protein